MLDFTSALYLGLRHPASSLGPWEALSLGRPAALQDPPGAEALSTQLARLQGCEAATLLPSTLHLFWDLFEVLAMERVAFLCDSGMYPIARWGTERQAAAGVPIHEYPHRDVRAVADLARRAMRRRLKPVIVSDGYCPGCGRPAPVRAYAEIARRCGGYTVLDDTQALGILGQSPDPANPFGIGGGGSLRWHGTFSPHVVVGSSLAKGFGAPIAVLSGSRDLIERFRRESATRVHCSPPSVAAIRAAQQALHFNRQHGETARRRLLELVLGLRASLSRAGLVAVGQLPFPAQTFRAAEWLSVEFLQRQLRRRGVVALLTTACRTLAAGLTLLVTVRHRLADIDCVQQAIAHALPAIQAKPTELVEVT